MRSHWVKQQVSHVLLFARQEIFDKYHGRMLGSFWLVLQPLAYLIIFSLVFSELMRAKLTGFEAQPYAYTIYLISGLLMWNFMNNVLSQLVQVFQTKSALIRKVPISLSIVPLYIPVAESVVYFFSMLFFFVFLIFIGHSLAIVYFSTVVVWFLAFLMVYGLGLTLALLGIFLPDIRTGMSIFLQLIFWLTPIVYLPTILPSWMQQLMSFNPFAWPVMAMQDIVLYHRYPDFLLLVEMFLFALFFLGAARWIQKKLEKDIRDLL